MSTSGIANEDGAATTGRGDVNTNVMDNHSTSVRKSAFGRTSLFLTGHDRVLVRCVRTTSAAMRRRDGSTYHNLATTATRARVPICCWHCCEPITGETFVVPKSYDPNENVFYTYGHFDSLACAKAFLLEQASFDHGHQANVFSKMVREVYKIHEEIQEAPPRVSLQRFGGPFDITKFKNAPTRTVLIEPPFVSYCMLVEERAPTSELSDTIGRQIGHRDTQCDFRGSNVVDEDEFAEPPPRSMYDEFLAGTVVGPSETTVSGGGADASAPVVAASAVASSSDDKKRTAVTRKRRDRSGEQKGEPGPSTTRTAQRVGSLQKYFKS